MAKAEKPKKTPAKKSAAPAAISSKPKAPAKSAKKDEEEDFLEFSHRVSRIELVNKEKQQKIASKSKLTNGDDDDLDIDNI